MTGNAFTASWRDLQAGNVAPSGQSNSVSTSLLGGSKGFTHLTAKDANRIQGVTFPKRGGIASLRMEVHTGDIGGSSTNRVDMSSAIAADGTFLFPGDDVWIRLSFYFPGGYPIYPTTSPDGWLLLYQLFGQSTDLTLSAGSPPFAIEVTQTSSFGSATMDFSGVVRGGDTVGPSASPPYALYKHIAATSYDEWHDLLVHYTMATNAATSNGNVDVYHRKAGEAWPGSPNASWAGVTNVRSISGVSLPVYHVVNLYRSDRSEAQVMYVGPVICRQTRAQIDAFLEMSLASKSGSLVITELAR